jgi:hypothetical protein
MPSAYSTRNSEERLRKRGVSVEGSEDLDYLVALARRTGVDIPYTEDEPSVSLVKGKVSVSEVAWIDDGVFQDPETLEERKYVVVLLKTPREARYRGLREEPYKPSTPTLESVRGKLVLSRSDGILGISGGLVVGPGELGVRAYRRYGGLGFINWIGFLNSLKKKGMESEYEELAMEWDPLINPRLPLARLREVKRRVSEISDSLAMELEAFIVRSDERALYRDIPWTRVVSVRDAIIVE